MTTKKTVWTVNSELEEKIQALRRERRMSLNELSKKSGVSKSLLSHIERGMSVPTVTTLQKIAKALDTSISNLFSESEEDKSSLSLAAKTMVSNRVFVVRKEYRKKLITPWGVMQEMLCPDLQHQIELIYLRYPVGGGMGGSYSHEGEECGVVIEGRLKGTIGNQVVFLEEGDSIYFDSSIPHCMENAGETEATAIWAITPPSF